MTTAKLEKPVPVRKEIDSLKSEIAGIKDQGERTNDLLTQLLARNNPVIISQRDESEEHQIGHENVRTMKSTGPAKDSLDSRLADPIEFASMSKAENLAFDNEELVIVVADTTNQNDVAVPVVWNDGRAQYFIRNQEQKVKRKYVEVLGRLKKTTYTQRLIKDHAGNDTYQNIPHTALMYPFSVVFDPSRQRGRDWLKKLLNEN